jgi:hypothetical protein
MVFLVGFGGLRPLRLCGEAGLDLKNMANQDLTLEI